ncbi:helix-turn-helix domain-containing protein [Aurantimonas sp. MSK8Z-1]|uniref:helix-turn-helix domain-containing protein n=1 Tax=Mangrovibrevibacter kandeliae TaxID=2968473 RepID=UPI00211952B0|nr:helix-turn-helix domain-containing protein [Aurantimonas sp. MSK8Z-1]MCW4115490.1 helix-turn-helix domain-containing protein [Aurantimonas sp. MSK8Z-1]
MRTSRFSTDDLRPEERFDVWRDAMSTSHDITADPAGFYGEVVTAKLGRMLLHRMSASPQQVERSAGKARRDSLEHFVLHLSSRDITALAGDREIKVPGGAISVNDLARPSLRASAPEDGSLIVSLSRDLVEEVLPNTDGLHGLVLSGATGLLLADFIRSTAAALEHLPSAAASEIARATAHLFAASVAPSRRTLGEAAEPLRGAALLRARRYIERNLALPSLDPEMVATAIGLSKATLFRLFQPLGGVATYIQRRRLARAHEALAGATRDRPRIAEVAYAVGFSDPAHFSRAFRTLYGMTPRDVLGTRGREAARDRTALDPEGFPAWVRELG